MSFHGPTVASLPALKHDFEELEVLRSEIQVFDLNPFAFYVNYDSIRMQNVDNKVQEFGQQFTDGDCTDEPNRWALVFVDDHWFRAEVLEKYYNSNEECSAAEVSLIDTGYKTVVEINHIFPMRPEVLTAGPAQCLRIFPKNVDRSSTRQLNILFDTYPDMKIRIKFEENLNGSSQHKPHLVGTFAKIEVGYTHWIPLEQLLERFVEDIAEDAETSKERNFAGSESEDECVPSDDSLSTMRDNGASSNGSRRCERSILMQDVRQPAAVKPKTRNERTNGRVSSSRLRSTSYDVSDRGRVSAQPNGDSSENDRKPRSEVRSSQHGTSRTKQIFQLPKAIHDTGDDDGGVEDDNDDETGEVVQKSGDDVPCFTYSLNNNGIPTEVEGANQAAHMTERWIANAKIVAKKNEIREKACSEFRKRGVCPNGQYCCFTHDVAPEKLFTATGETTEFQDFPELNPGNIKTGFAVCTHVDEHGTIYLVLPYGPMSIWDVLDSGPKELEASDIINELSECYDHKRNSSRSAIGSNEYLAVAWLENSENGPLRNVPPGWYRAKILSRTSKSCEVYLVDHGAQLRVKSENLYPLEPKLRRFPQQAVRCHLQETELMQTAEEMYKVLKRQILIFTLYERRPDDNLHVVELFSGDGFIHYGDFLLEKKIVRRIDS